MTARASGNRPKSGPIRRDSALVADLQDRGFALLPIQPTTNLLMREDQTDRSPADASELSCWLENGVNYDIGILCGAPSRIWVLEFRGKSAESWVKRNLPPTGWRMRTANGLERRFFRAPFASPSGSVVHVKDQRIKLHLYCDGDICVLRRGDARLGSWTGEPPKFTAPVQLPLMFPPAEEETADSAAK